MKGIGWNERNQEKRIMTSMNEENPMNPRMSNRVVAAFQAHPSQRPCNPVTSSFPSFLAISFIPDPLLMNLAYAITPREITIRCTSLVPS